MEVFNNAINSVNNVIWSTALVVFLLAVGLYFTLRSKGVQFRYFIEMCRLIGEKNEESKENGLTPFQAFATTVGARIGMGNIAGVGTALFFGGPGAIVWMQITALVGAASATVESTLGQAYKERSNGELIGGPAYYIEKGLHAKWLAVIFAIAAIMGPGLLMPAVQTHSTAVALQSSFGLPFVATGIIIFVLLGISILGGIQRIGKVAELLAPIMCIIYHVCGLVILFMNIGNLGSAIADMFTAAFGQNAMYKSIVGAMIGWGVKRGLFSNEAGQGSGPIVSSAAETTHPVKQGLIQGLSVYIDTLLVCTITGISLMVTGLYNVSANADGTVLIKTGLPGVEYGVSYMQDAMQESFGGTFGNCLLSVLIAIFVFTTLMAYYYQAEANLRYLSKGSKAATRVFQVVYLFANFLGVLVNGQVIWSMGDTGAGLMAWANLIGIVILSPVFFKILKDFDKQKKAGLDPLYDPATVGLEDSDGIWTAYVDKKKARGDYENPVLGYDKIVKK